MKRKIILVLFKLFFLASFSQRGGEAIYGVTYLDDDNENKKKLKEFFLSQRPNIETTANELLFTLKFNTESSVFFVNEFEGIADSYEIKLAQGMIGYGFKTWQNADYYYRYIERQSYVGQRTKKIEWKITNETKYIDGFLCYKATGFSNVINPKGEFKHFIIAWFCPEIPYSYGPLHFGGLPGLILELQTTQAVFWVKKITLKDNVEIEKIPNVYLKTEEEFQKEEQKFLEEYNKNKSK